MYNCKYCSRQFETPAQLGGHVRSKHSEDTAKKEAPSHSDDTYCPECGFELPWTTTWGDYGETVCPKCLTTFNEVSKEVSSRLARPQGSRPSSVGCPRSGL